MVGAIGVARRIGIDEAEPAPEEIEIPRRARQEGPAGAYRVALGVVAQHLWRVLDGIKRERVHENVAAYPIAEQLLHPQQVRRDRNTDPAASRVHEVEKDDLVLDEVLVQADRLSLVRDEPQVREVAPANLFPR